MNLTPKDFLLQLQSGKTEHELNRTETGIYDSKEAVRLIRHYGHTAESAREHLTCDYSNGFTICKKCGSFYHLGKGFTKHLSDGCLNCEGEQKHRIYHVNASSPKYGGFPARFMSQMFDDGRSYCKDKLQIGLLAAEVKPFKAA